MYRYEIILYWSQEDEVLIAEVPELAGCMAHGMSPQLALEAIHQAIDLWLETAAEFGDPIPQSKGRRLEFA